MRFYDKVDLDLVEKSGLPAKVIDNYKKFVLIVTLTDESSNDEPIPYITNTNGHLNKQLSKGAMHTMIRLGLVGIITDEELEIQKEYRREMWQTKGQHISYEEWLKQR